MNPIDRREFLLLGSSVLVVGPHALAAGSMPVETALQFSVGYAEPPMEVTSETASRISQLTSASALLQGDPVFLRRDAMVTFDGSITRGRADSIILSALYPVMVQGQSKIIPFHGWVFHVDSLQQSAPVRFFMPVHPEHGLSFSVRTPQGESVLRFAVHRSDAAFVLRRGTYFLALRLSDERVLDWASLTLRASDPDGMQTRLEQWDGEPAGLDYLSLAFDYADSEVVPTKRGSHV